MDSVAVDTATHFADSITGFSDSATFVVDSSWQMAQSGPTMSPPMMMPIFGDPMAFLGMFAGVFAAILLVMVFYAIVGWKLFVKAGKPGLAALVPVHNSVILLEIAGRPLWWIFLFFIPIVNFVVLIVVVFDLAKRFGKGSAFGFGMLFLGFIFYPILAFGKSRYQPLD